MRRQKPSSLGKIRRWTARGDKGSPAAAARREGGEGKVAAARVLALLVQRAWGWTAGVIYRRGQSHKASRWPIWPLAELDRAAEPSDGLSGVLGFRDLLIAGSKPGMTTENYSSGMTFYPRFRCKKNYLSLFLQTFTGEFFFHLHSLQEIYPYEDFVPIRKYNI